MGGMKKSPSLFFELLASGGDEQYLKSKLVDQLDLKKGAASNTVKVLDSCTEVEKVLRVPVLPVCPVSEAAATTEDDSELDLQSFTPEVILKELLGDLFIHPGRLTEEGKFGEGSFATVHKCTMAPPDGNGMRLQVAVKRLKPEVLKHASDLKEFLTEANLLRKLRHPNIVRVLGIGAGELASIESMRSSVYMVMEAMEGDDLKMMVLQQMTSSSKVYTMADALRWAIDMAEGMTYLHCVCKPMIIHRDLKLENITTTGGPVEGKVAKLADFGLHKRARFSKTAGKLVSAGASQHNASTAGVALARGSGGPLKEMVDRSYYGGQAFYANGSVRAGSVHQQPLQTIVEPTGGTPSKCTTPVGGPSATPSLSHNGEPLEPTAAASAAAARSSLYLLAEAKTTISGHEGAPGVSGRDAEAAPTGEAAGTSERGGRVMAQALRGGSEALNALRKSVDVARTGSGADESVAGSAATAPAGGAESSEPPKSTAGMSSISTDEAVKSSASTAPSAAAAGSLAAPTLIAAGASPFAAASGTPLPEAETTTISGDPPELSLLEQAALLRKMGGSSGKGSQKSASTPAGGSMHGNGSTHGNGSAHGSARGLPRNGSTTSLALLMADPEQQHNVASLQKVLGLQHGEASIRSGSAFYSNARSGSQVGLDRMADTLLGVSPGGSNAGSLNASVNGPGSNLNVSQHSLQQPLLSNLSVHRLANDSSTRGTFSLERKKTWTDLSTGQRQPSIAKALDDSVVDSALYGPAGPPPSSNANASLPDDKSVHRKMLALIALDQCAVAPFGQVAPDQCALPGTVNALTSSSSGTPATQQPVGGAASQPPPVSVGAAAAPALSMMSMQQQQQQQGMKTIPEDGRPSLDLHGHWASGPQQQKQEERIDLRKQPSASSSSPAAASPPAASPQQQQDPSVRRRQQQEQQVQLQRHLQDLQQAEVQKRQLDAAGWAATVKFTDATREVGSLMYMAPELLNGHCYNERVDVFSFAIMLYELFTGRLIALRTEFLMGGVDKVEEYAQRRAEGFRERLPPKWPRELSDLIADCWAQDPADRPSFDKILERLKHIQSAGTLAGLAGGRPGYGGSSGSCCSLM